MYLDKIFILKFLKFCAVGFSGLSKVTAGPLLWSIFRFSLSHLLALDLTTCFYGCFRVN
jgi:hypothetical protein